MGGTPVPVDAPPAVVEAELTRIVLYDEVPADADGKLTNTGTVLRAPVIDSHGKILGIIESVNKTKAA